MGAKWQRPMNNNDPAEAHDQAVFWPSSINILTQESFCLFTHVPALVRERASRGERKESGAIFHVTESLSLVDTCIGEMMEDQLNRQERARILLAGCCGYPCVVAIIAFTTSLTMVRT